MKKAIYFYLLNIFFVASCATNGAGNCSRFIDYKIDVASRELIENRYLVQSKKHIDELNDALIVDGKIGEETYFQIRKYIEEKGSQKKLVIKNLTGGDPIYAIEIGRLVASKNVDIYVENGCHSGCAYMILPAADAVYLKKTAVLLFHGLGVEGVGSFSLYKPNYGLIADKVSQQLESMEYAGTLRCKLSKPNEKMRFDENQIMEEVEDKIGYLVNEINGFRQQLGLDERYESYGMEGSDYNKAPTFTYSGAMLKKMGLKNITWEEGFPEYGLEANEYQYFYNFAEKASGNNINIVTQFRPITN